MMLVLLVALLGAAGAVVRAHFARTLPPLFSTLAINVLAAFLLGASASWTGVVADGFRIGLLGAASTWSTLANELAALLRERHVARAGLYLGSTLALGVLAAWVGLQVS